MLGNPNCKKEVVHCVLFENIIVILFLKVEIYPEEGGQPIYEYEEGYGQSYGMYSGDMQLETLTTSSISTANSKYRYPLKK